LKVSEEAERGKKQEGGGKPWKRGKIQVKVPEVGQRKITSSAGSVLVASKSRSSRSDSGRKREETAGRRGLLVMTGVKEADYHRRAKNSEKRLIKRIVKKSDSRRG